MTVFVNPYIPAKLSHGVGEAEDTGADHGGNVVEGRVPPLAVPRPRDRQPFIQLLLLVDHLRCGHSLLPLEATHHAGPDGNDSDDDNRPTAMTARSITPLLSPLLSPTVLTAKLIPLARSNPS